MSECAPFCDTYSFYIHAWLPVCHDDSFEPLWVVVRPQTEVCGNCRGRLSSLFEIIQIVTLAVDVLCFMQHKFPVMMLIIIFSPQSSIFLCLATDGCVQALGGTGLKINFRIFLPGHATAPCVKAQLLRQVAVGDPVDRRSSPKQSDAPDSRGHTGKRCFIGGCNLPKFTVVTPSKKLDAQEMANARPRL